MQLHTQLEQHSRCCRDTIFEYLTGPLVSPDLNPIEHVWDEIDRRVRQFPQPQNLVDLERDLVNIWNNLPQRFLFNYVKSMRSRCLAVVRANRVKHALLVVVNFQL